ncbi:group III truncated hemoglobin [Lutibacter sp. HS1-25]|uniref:group III truncated hemoglobin n=1 Tax=Lutibacter sp. HS1-25 TaxID=2485000 RepID=UPI001010DE0B|nr:group III truncated hemoglobin [Lutibacter sp. HS1-25]
MEKKDIESRDDIYLLVKTFYVKLMNDKVMCHFFEEFKNPVHLETHLQTLVDFWSNILFYTGEYRKNAMQPHLDLQSQMPFETIHFTHWLSSFNQSVDELFDGAMAHTAKSRALSIATVMKIKILEINK